MELSGRAAGRIAWSILVLALVAAIVAESMLASTVHDPDSFSFMVLVFPAVGSRVGRSGLTHVDLLHHVDGSVLTTPLSRWAAAFSRVAAVGMVLCRGDGR